MSKRQVSLVYLYYLNVMTIALDKALVFNQNVLGPVVQSIVSLTSSLVVKMLTVLVSTISNSQVFLHFFSKHISKYAIFNNQSFNNMLTNDIVSFEQMGPDIFKFLHETMLWVLIQIRCVSPRCF